MHTATTAADVLDVQDAPPAPPDENNMIVKAGEIFKEQAAAAANKHAARMKEIADEQTQKTNDKKKEDEKKPDDVSIKGHWENSDWRFSVSVPEVTTEDSTVSFDVPVVEMKRNDIKVDVPVVVMKTVDGPSIPETTLEWTNDGWLGTPSPTLRTNWKKTSLDVPTTEWRTQEYSFDVPTTLRTERQELKMKVPKITMVQRDMVVTHPVFIVEEVQIAGVPIVRKDIEANYDAITADAQAKREEATKTFNTEMMTAFRTYVPGLVAGTQMMAIGGFKSQADSFAEESLDLKAQRLALTKEGVHPGDPRRAKIEQRLAFISFMFNNLSSMANAAIFQFHQDMLSKLEEQGAKFGLSKEAIEAELARAGMLLPGSVQFSDEIR